MKAERSRPGSGGGFNEGASASGSSLETVAGADSPNQRIAREFLAALFPHELEANERIELRWKNGTGGMDQKWFTNTEALVDYAFGLETDVYFGAGLRKGEQGGDANVTRLVALLADIDTKCFASEADALQTVREFTPRPTAIVASGHGFQPWWLLQQPVAPAAAKPVLEALRDRLSDGAQKRLDNVTNPERIMRLPGTRNFKDDPPLEVFLLEANFDRRYELEDFKSLLGLGAKAAKSTSHHRFDEDPRRGVAEGHRDEAIFHRAWVLVKDRLDRATVEAEVLEMAANCRPAFPPHEALRKVASAFKRYAERFGDKDQPKRFPRTDAGNGELFAHLYGDEVRYDHTRTHSCQNYTTLKRVVHV